MTLRTLIILLLITSVHFAARAQELTRAQIAPYTLRRDAEAAQRTSSEGYIEFIPSAVSSSHGFMVREQQLEVPQSWLDATAFLHLEGVGAAYTLEVNGSTVAQCEDSLSPVEYNISSYLRVGSNVIRLTTRQSQFPQLESGVSHPKRSPLEGSYIFTQSRLRIADYRAEVISVEEGKHGQLLLDVVVENHFNYPETIEVGFDVYDPAGNLVDFSTSQATIAGGGRDTIRFAPYLYGAEKYRWAPDEAVGMQKVGRPVSRYTDQPLYSVMLFTKHNRVSSGYIPFKVGFTVPQYSDGALTSLGTPLDLRTKRYNALGTPSQSEAELREIRLQGFNTITPDYPQPLWFYSLCSQIGLYVVEQAAINAPEAAEDRQVGGSPSNDPALKDEYLRRVQRAYYRTRNFSCVVAYSLGGESGNGYNMYKAYQWLKGVEKSRPIIYKGAAGEWNDDALTLK